MRHLNVVVIAALMAVPFGVAIYQDSKKTEKERMRELLGGLDGDPYASDDFDDFDSYDSYDSSESRARLAEIEREIAEMRARGGLDDNPYGEKDEDEVPPAPIGLDASSIEQLVGKERGQLGRAIEPLALGMKVSEVADLPNLLLSWLDGDDGPVEARIAVDYIGPDDTYVGAIRLAFEDDGKALRTISEAWGEPQLVSDRKHVWMSADQTQRMILTTSEYENAAELVFSKVMTAEALIAPDDAKRLGFEKVKAILGSSRSTVMTAYPTATGYEDSENVFIELPGFQGSASATLEAQVTFGEESHKAEELELNLDFSLAPLLQDTVISLLERKYGAPAESPDDYDLEFGKPLKVGVSTGSASLRLHFFK